MVKDANGTIADLKANATWMSSPDTKSAERYIETGAKSMGDSARELDAGHFVGAWTNFFLAYQDFGLTSELLNRLTEAQIKSATNMIEDLHNIEHTSEFLLAVLGGGLEAGVFKVAAALVPAAAMASEDVVSKLVYHMDGEYSLAEIGVKGLSDLVFAAIGTGLDKTAFKALDNRIFAKVLKFDVVTQTTLNQLTPTAKLFLTQKVVTGFLAWLKANVDTFADEHIKKNKKAVEKGSVATESVLEIALNDFAKDSGGGALVNLVRETSQINGAQVIRRPNQAGWIMSVTLAQPF